MVIIRRESHIDNNLILILINLHFVHVITALYYQAKFHENTLYYRRL